MFPFRGSRKHQAGLGQQRNQTETSFHTVYPKTGGTVKGGKQILSQIHKKKWKKHRTIDIFSRFYTTGISSMKKTSRKDPEHTKGDTYGCWRKPLTRFVLSRCQDPF